jgi:general secretion pathway protein A
MVLDYYKLREHPFGVTPDSRFLFMSATHREALASLLYGVQEGCGFLALIAKPGLGKTTLLYHTLNELRGKALTVFLFQTVCTPVDLLRTLLAGLGVQNAQGSLVEMQLKVREILLEQARLGKRVVVVIDEAQNLDDSVLETVRMLSNFETSRKKLIQIVLSGQPQLAEKMGSPGLEQLRQRVSIFACLKPFSREDTRLYIEHRLRFAGLAGDAPLFTEEALTLIADHSEGIPRNINNLCFNSLSLGCALRRNPVDGNIVREVIGDLDLGQWRRSSFVAALPADTSVPQLPAFLAEANTSTVIEGRSGAWVPKLAIAMVALLAVGGAVFEVHRWPVPKTAVQATHPTAPTKPAALPPSPNPKAEPRRADGAVAEAERGTPPVVANPLANAGSTSAEQETTAAIPATEVQVTPGRTLLGICVENYGSCNAQLLQEIHRQNPRLNNLDHIETGQSIRLPAAQRTPGGNVEEARVGTQSAEDRQH